MTRTLTAALKRTRRLLRPAGTKKAAKSLGKAMSTLMVKSALAPLAAITPKPAKRRKTAAPKAGPKASRSLGAVVRQLRAAQSLLAGGNSRAMEPAASPRIPAGARYLAHTHRSAAGSRDYKLYLPASQPQPKGLILMLHGCNQSPDDFARGTHMNAMAEKHGLAVAYPAQSGASNSAACWNWFKPGDQARGAGEPAILASLARKLMKEYGLGREAVFVAGLSAGGAMAAILADVYPEIFSAAGVHSGLARGSAHNVLSSVSAMRNGGTAKGTMPAAGSRTHPVRRIVFHGDADSTVHPSNATRIVAATVGARAVPAKVTRRSVRGRGYVRSDYAVSDCAGPGGAILLELWMLTGAGHSWSGGRAAGSYTDDKGPDASAQMIRFFLANPAHAATPTEPRGLRGGLLT